MAHLLQIAQLGNPILRQEAKPITDYKSDEIQSLIDDMLATVLESQGVGLAAPQVYASYRLFIMASHPNSRYPYAPYMEPFALINPEINKHSEETEKDWEGCLSVPGIRGLVPRYKKIQVRYITRDGLPTEKEFSDFLARIFQHEYDHINGIAFIDRVENSKDLISEKEFQRLLQKKN